MGNTLNSIAAAMFFVSKYIPSVGMFFVGRVVIGFSGGEEKLVLFLDHTLLIIL